jgi:RimJ/RimL family protein N-acetyltransferase
VEPLEIRVDDLLLRSWRPTDAEDMVRARDDAAISRWSNSSPVPYLLKDARDFIEIARPENNDGTAVGGAITDTATGELLGSAALFGIDKRTRIAEIGYWSAPWARGRRVAERACRALLSWGFTNLDLARVDWHAVVGNHASRLIALRLGFTVVGLVPRELRRRDDSRVDEWYGWQLPGQLTAADFEVPEPVRRAAHTFGHDQPVLCPGRVTLRRPVTEDEPGIVAAYRDPESARWFGGPQPYTEAHAAQYVRDHVPTEWARGVEAIFAVVDPDDAYVGSIDLRVSPTDPAVGEVGFVIAPRARGRGYATAALRAISRWGFDALGLARIEWRAELGNDASRRVAQKAGFTFEGVQRAGIDRRGTRRDTWVAATIAADRSEVRKEARA